MSEKWLKKVHGQSLSLRVRKNSCNFISNGPILLVWVTHGKFELEGWIQKLFMIKPRALTTMHLETAMGQCARN